jgi:ornithine--oxo-acid transaminase
MKHDDYISMEEQFGAHNYKPLDVVLCRGEGVWVWDVDGNRYLDCLSAYSAVNQGHCHPKILADLLEQSKRLTLTSRAFRNDQLGPLYKELCELTNSHKVLPMNSGAEAVETAIKTVRKWGYQVKGVPEDRAEIIVCPTIFTAGPSPSWASAPTRGSRKGASGPLHRGSRSSPLTTPRPWKRPLRPTPSALWWSPFRARRASSCPTSGYLRRPSGFASREPSGVDPG